MLRSFRSNRNFLASYHARFGFCLLAVNIALYIFRTPSVEKMALYIPCILLLSSPQIISVLFGYAYGITLAMTFQEFDSIQLFEIPIALILTFPITALLHCASHNSIRPKWLNRPIGELTGLMQLYGFPDWTVLHFIHHSFSDDRELDPHAPGNQTFWQFILGMRDSASAAFLKYYFKQFGNNPESVRAATRFARLSKFDTLMKVTFWFLLFGPQTFSFLFITSIAFKMLHYAWLNFHTHRGGEIRNLNSGLLYPAINFIAFGVYFHRNHHLAPSLFDPRNLEKVRAVKDDKFELDHTDRAA